jgi:cytochrome P450
MLNWIFGICVGIYFILRWSSCRSGRKVVLGYPFIGFAFTKHFTPSSFSYTILNLATTYGPIIDIFAFTRRFTILADAEDIQEVLMRRPKVFERPDLKAAASINLSGGLVGSNGAKWSLLRRAVAPSFSKKNVEKYVAHIWEECGLNLRNIKADGTTVCDFIDFSTTFTIRIIGQLAFGLSESDDSLYFFSPDFKRDLQAILLFISQRVLSGLPPFLWYLSPKYRLQQAAQAARDRVAAVAMQLVEKKQMSSPEYDGTFLHSIIRAREEADLGPAGLVTNLVDIFIAGTDTTSISMCWTLFFLSQNPSILAALREEVDAAFQQVKIATMEEIHSSLKLCTACVTEAMRLRGPVAIVAAQTTDRTAPTTLRSGRTIYPDDYLWCALDAPKMDPAVFPEPRVFDPHRWLRASPEQLRQMELHCMTFGHGPRECPGMSLAYVEGPFMVAHIVRHFDFYVACPADEIVRVAKVTAGPNKMPLVFSPRKDLCLSPQ